MRRTSFLASITIVAAGCSTLLGEAIADNQCNGNGNCPIDVTVTPKPGGCEITDPGTTLVKKNARPTLTWRIVGPGAGQFTFPQGGIAFKGSPPTGEFNDLGRMANGAEYHVKDNNNQKPPQVPPPPTRQYAYKITVVGNNTPGCDKDPIVANEGCDDTGCP